MSKTRRKAKSLIEEDSEMESVLERVLEIQEENSAVEWGDLRGDATSGQWGRLIEKGILVDAETGDGFAVEDEDDLRDFLGIETDGESDVSSITETDVEVEDIDTSWSIYDKGAALVGIFLIVFGYRDEEIQAMIGGVINRFVLPLHETAGLPYYLIILVFAVLTGMYSSYLQLYLMDWDWVKAQQKKVKEIQSQLKEAQMGDDEEREEELQEEQMEVMSEQMKMFKMQFRPSVWILVFTIPIFLWLFWTFSTRFGGEPHLTGEAMPEIILPFIGTRAFSASVFSTPSFLEGWLFWYILCSFGFGQIMRKVLGVNPTT
ncbi:MAG: EMC3/TMCO1 family protein [Halobacteriales archaeon]|nr:EMC3/TMCO1 family protein [Halobacteriales archaeon]